MHLKEKGQALLVVIMILGVIMAAVVIFGAKRQEDMAVLIERLDTSQSAQEILSAAAKKVQYIYSSEAGCDPDILDLRLSRLPSVSSNATDFGTGMSFAIAQMQKPGATPALTLDEKINRCSSAAGCRQFGVPVENRVHIVTVGKVVTGVKPTAGACPLGGDPPDICARDATVRLHLAIGGNLYFQRFSLINICTFKSCNCYTGYPTDLANGQTDDFDGITAVATADSTQTTACGSGLPARWHGSIVSSTNTQTTKDDIRWARRYLDTGGGGTGETTFMFGAPASGNGACSDADSVGQCLTIPCVPAFDLNRDRTNNEVDLAILESFMRGLLPSLSPNQLTPSP